MKAAADGVICLPNQKLFQLIDDALHPDALVGPKRQTASLYDALPPTSHPVKPGGEVNMALVPRQTGSSLKAFLLAMAYEAGAQTNDIINGAQPCSVPDYVNGHVLYCGDAAHLLPIFGVRGANTAFQDAQALGWQDRKSVV